MATLKVTIKDQEWTKIATDASSGSFQNTSAVPIVIRESIDDPGASVNDGFKYKQGERDTFGTTIGLWARSQDPARTSANIDIHVTEA